MTVGVVWHLAGLPGGRSKGRAGWQAACGILTEVDLPSRLVVDDPRGLRLPQAVHGDPLLERPGKGDHLQMAAPGPVPGHHLHVPGVGAARACAREQAGFHQQDGRATATRCCCGVMSLCSEPASAGGPRAEWPAPGARKWMKSCSCSRRKSQHRARTSRWRASLPYTW